MAHPCRSCGACCAALRVCFPRRELDSEQGNVPASLTVPDIAFTAVMRGTWAEPRRCTALDGEPGVWTTCRIHAVRPSVCRAFEPAWADGVPNEICDEVRLGIGLEPLAPGWDKQPVAREQVRR